MTVTLANAQRACDLLAAFAGIQPMCNSDEFRHAVAVLCEFVHDRVRWMGGGENAAEPGMSSGRMVIEVYGR